MRFVRVRPAFPCLAAIAAALAATTAAVSLTAESEERSAPAGQDLVGLVVDVTLATGETIAEVKILKVMEGKVLGTIRSLTIQDGSGGKPKLLGAASVREVAPPGGRALLVYNRAVKALVPPDQAVKSGPLRSSKAADAESRPAADAPDAKQQRHRAALAGKGIVLWPRLSDEEQRAVVEAQRASLEEINQKIPSRGMKLYETKRFLFYSDIPAPMINTMFVPYLDQMYVKLCSVYGMDPETNIFRGKALIVAYADPENFEAFEATIFHAPISATACQGLAHMNSRGDVTIGCHLGSRVGYFAMTLVHETAHGFTHRFKSSVHVNSWLNEGISEWVANMVVTQDDGVRNKVRLAVHRMTATHSMGGDFFTAEHIANWQYGISASMVDFLLKYTPPASAHGKTAAAGRRAKPHDNASFRKLLEGIKEGTPWEQCLQEIYGMTPDELAERYGQYMGIPNLKP